MKYCAKEYLDFSPLSHLFGGQGKNIVYAKQILFPHFCNLSSPGSPNIHVFPPSFYLSFPLFFAILFRFTFCEKNMVSMSTIAAFDLISRVFKRTLDALSHKKVISDEIG